MNKAKPMHSYSQDFHSFAADLLNKEVEVVTSDGTYTGTLVEVGSDILILQTRMRGQRVRLAIRIALIVALFRFLIGPTGPFWVQGPGRPMESDDIGEENEFN